VSAGSLAGTTSSLQGTIVNNAALTFDQPVDGSFSGSITGTGSVTKIGAGSLTLSGAHLFGGNTTIGQGTLQLDGALGGNVNIGAAGTLRGAGVIAGNVNVGGSIFVPAPGSSLATFNFLHGLRLSSAAAPAPDQSPSLIINGDLTTTPGSTFGVTVAPGAAPPIIVNGRATIAGTHFNVGVDDPNPTRSASYVALTAANGLTMSDTNVSNLSTTLVPVLSANANTLFVTLLNFAIPLAGTVTLPNAIAAARAIDAVKIGSSGDLGAVVREVTALDDAHLTGALTSLAGEIHASEQRLSIQDSLSITDLVRTELSEFEHDAQDDPGYAARGRQPPVWYQLTGEHATFRSGSFSGATANVGGGAGGVDFMPTRRWSVGGGGSLSLGGMSLTDISGSSQMTAPRAFGYSGFSFGPFHVHGGGSAARSSYSTTRQIAFAAIIETADGQVAALTDGVNRTADSDQTGVTRDAWSEWQHTAKFHTWTLDSKLGVRAAHYSRRAFSETGANAISLDGNPDALASRESDVNIHLFRRSGVWRPRVLLDFRRQIGDEAPTADVQFAGRADSQFIVNGLPVPRNAFQGLFGLTMRTGSGFELTFEYETQQAVDESHNAVHFRMRFR
jgi:fibronectin-binding autotransporter adhesin